MNRSGATPSNVLPDGSKCHGGFLTEGTDAYETMLQTSEILAAEKTTSSRVSADFTLICDRQHDITGSRTRDLTTPEQRSSRLRHEPPLAKMFATQRVDTHSCLRKR